MTLETTSYICIASHPVSEWYDLSDDPWILHEQWLGERVWDALEWLGPDWLWGRICQRIRDDVWEEMVDRDDDDRLYEAVAVMIRARGEEPSDD